MFEITYINTQPLVRRAVIGARADDPVLPERAPRRRQAGRPPRTARRWLPVSAARAAELKPRGTS
jgi:hypothetical protein